MKLSSARKKKEIYLDYAAATYVRKEVQEAMQPYFDKIYGNPGSPHLEGMAAKEAVNGAREKIKSIIGADNPEEIIFTGSATESINLAIKGFARANKEKGKHIITSKIEHEAVLATCQYLEKYEGFDVTYLDVDQEGLVLAENFQDAIRDDTILASIMAANNEIGTVQPILRLAAIAHEKGIVFHTDACQAGGALVIQVKKWGVDLMTLNAAKMYGPKGVGLLYVKKGISLQPIVHGGGQEFGLRSGTLNVPGIVGFARALELAQAERETETRRLIGLRGHFIDRILITISDVHLNGSSVLRLPNNISLSFQGVDGETLQSYLNAAGIYASSGSACSSASKKQSHVLAAMKAPSEEAVIRFTLGKTTTREQLNEVVSVLSEIVESLRKLSPIEIMID